MSLRVVKEGEKAPVTARVRALLGFAKQTPAGGMVVVRGGRMSERAPDRTGRAEEPRTAAQLHRERVDLQDYIFICVFAGIVVGGGFVFWRIEAYDVAKLWIGAAIGFLGGMRWGGHRQQ
jgi:hypothetical protein